MRKTLVSALLAMFLAAPVMAADKESGKTTLKDMQPAGTTDKNHKKQQYDLTFATTKHEFTCRSNENEKLDATNFVVGTGINYKIDGNKGEVKSTSSGKSVKCTIVRVAALTANP